MIAVLVAVAAATGVYLLYTEFALGWRGFRRRLVGPRRSRQLGREWLVQAGLADVRMGEFVGVMAALFVLGAVLGFAVFGGPVPALGVGGFAASFPPASSKARRSARRAAAQDAWPR